MSIDRRTRSGSGEPAPRGLAFGLVVGFALRAVERAAGVRELGARPRVKVRRVLREALVGGGGLTQPGDLQSRRGDLSFVFRSHGGKGQLRIPQSRVRLGGALRVRGGGTRLGSALGLCTGDCERFPKCLRNGSELFGVRAISLGERFGSFFLAGGESTRMGRHTGGESLAFGFEGPPELVGSSDCGHEEVFVSGELRPKGALLLGEPPVLRCERLRVRAITVGQAPRVTPPEPSQHAFGPIDGERLVGARNSRDFASARGLRLGVRRSFLAVTKGRSQVSDLAFELSSLLLAAGERLRTAREIAPQ